MPRAHRWTIWFANSGSTLSFSDHLDGPSFRPTSNRLPDKAPYTEGCNPRRLDTKRPKFDAKKADRKLRETATFVFDQYSPGTVGASPAPVECRPSTVWHQDCHPNLRLRYELTWLRCRFRCTLWVVTALAGHSDSSLEFPAGLAAPVAYVGA